MRLDTYIRDNYEDISRSQAIKFIKNGQVLVDAICIKKPAHVVDPEKSTVVVVRGSEEQKKELLGELPGFKVVHEEKDFAVIFKPAGINVHRAHAHDKEPSLVDYLIHTFKTLSDGEDASRPGIVHRLDKDTSGIMLVMKTNDAHKEFKQLFKLRRITKEYLAVVHNIHHEKEGLIDAPIARHMVKRQLMVVDEQGKPAQTKFECVFSTSKPQPFSVLKLWPLTGRTHQIRVHCKAIGLPVIGDRWYVKKTNELDELSERLMLQAKALQFTYKGKAHHYTVPTDTKIANFLEKFGY